MTLINYPEGRHAFEIDQNTVESKRIIEQTLDFLHHHLTTEATPRKPEPMSLADVQRLLRDTPEALTTTLLALQKTHPAAFVLDERTLNTLGYTELQARRAGQAIVVLELVTKLYPQSANAHDSLGDAYEAAGRNADAIAASERALRLVDALAPQQREAIEASAQAKLQRLKQ